MQVGQPFNPYRIFQGVFIPQAIVSNKDLTPSEKLLYGQLCRYAGKDGKCWPKQSTLAGDLCLSERQVNTNIKQLANLDFLKVNRAGLNQPNSYEFLWHKSFGDPGTENTSDPDRQSTSDPEMSPEAHFSPDTKPTSGPLRDSLNLKDSAFEESHGRESMRAPEAELKSDTDSRLETSINSEHLETPADSAEDGPATAEDIHHSNLPPNSETGPPAWESGDSPAPLHERNLAKGIERMAKDLDITQRRLSQPFKQQLKRTDEVKRREGQEEFEAWRGLLGAGVIDYGADQSVGTLEQALRKLKSFGAFPTRDRRPTGAVTANGPAPEAGACQKLITQMARDNKLSFQGQIPSWKWAVLEAMWYRDRDEFLERAKDHFKECAADKMTGDGTLEALFDNEQQRKRRKPTPGEQYADDMTRREKWLTENKEIEELL